jgi:hypothetical protein
MTTLKTEKIKIGYKKLKADTSVKEKQIQATKQKSNNK